MRINTQDIGMEYGIEMWHANNEKLRTTKDGRNRITKSRKKIRTFWEKETYKYLEILGADTIKHKEMKEKKIPQEDVKTTRNQTT